MASCLGLYIENNLIKYAKVSKNNDAVKVESFGVKFYDNIESAIKQIIQETYSFKIPISINIPEEHYAQFEVFSLLSKKDIDGVVKTEFENFCYDQDLNPNLFEQKYIIGNSNVQSEKIRIIHVSTPKTAIAQRNNQFSEYKISSMVPLGITIQNLVKKEKKTASLVVNIEKQTTITKIYNGAVSDITILPIGSQDIIENINKKENSYAKAYEICKNTTIYSEQDKDLQYEENEYLVDIMPILFQIVTEVKKIADESLEKIEKVYITGTGAVINNIDIYFQEYLENAKCEILKPSFINNNSKINIKDYIEVNSAISIGFQGLEKNNTINFIKESAINKILKLLKSDVSKQNASITAKGISDFIDKFSKVYNVAAITALLFVISYFTGASLTAKRLDNKIELANQSISTTRTQMAQVQQYTAKFNEEITNYERLIRNNNKKFGK